MGKNGARILKSVGLYVDKRTALPLGTCLCLQVENGRQNLRESQLIVSIFCEKERGMGEGTELCKHVFSNCFVASFEISTI